MSHSATQRQPNRLMWALLASIVVHLVLILLVKFAGDVLIPVTPAVIPEPEETLLEFSFFDEPSEGEEPVPEGQTMLVDNLEPSRPTVSRDPVPVGTPVEQPIPAAPEAVEAAPIPIEQPRDQIDPERPEPIEDEQERTEPQDTNQDDGESNEVTNEPEPIDGTRYSAPERPKRSLDAALQRFARDVRRSTASQPQSRQGSNQTVFVPDGSELPAAGAPYGVLKFSSADFDWTDYARQIYQRILEAWYSRIYQTTNEFERWGRDNEAFEVNHSVDVRFTIQQNGDVTAVLVLRPSSCDPLDLSASDALHEVLLPPLPRDFPRDSETVTGTFIMRGAVFEFRRYMTYLKRLGAF